MIKKPTWFYAARELRLKLREDYHYGTYLKLDRLITKLTTRIKELEAKQ